MKCILINIKMSIIVSILILKSRQNYARLISSRIFPAKRLPPTGIVCVCGGGEFTKTEKSLRGQYFAGLKPSKHC